MNVRKNTNFHDFEVEHDFETIGRKIMHLNARRIYDQGDQTQLILLAIEDVTEREYYKRHLEELVEERTAEIRKLKDQLEAERAYLQEEIKLEFNHENIIGRSNEIKYVFYKVEQIAAADTNVLVLGETGTGKELLAKVIHYNSDLKDKPFIAIAVVIENSGAGGGRWAAPTAALIMERYLTGKVEEKKGRVKQNRILKEKKEREKE